MKKCPNCGKSISKSAKHCKSCSQRGDRNHRKGKHSHNYLGERHNYCIDCGKEICLKSKRCRTCSRTGKLSWSKSIKGKANKNFKGGKPKCVGCGKTLSAYHVKRCKSCEMKRRWSNNECDYLKGLSPSWKLFNYKNKNFKSSWEVIFAYWLDISNIKWKYEPKSFELIVNKKNVTYTPDFYLPEFDCWIEIKGWWRKNSIAKFKSFCKVYTENIKVVDRKRLCELTSISLTNLNNLPKILLGDIYGKTNSFASCK